MKSLIKGIFLTGIYILFSHLLPGQETLKWYKGNLHTHSLWSDGDEFPEVIMDWYKTNGYHFVGLSDHNILQEGEKWARIPKSPIRREAFEDYLQTYGEDWVEYRRDSLLTVKLKTLPEYRGLFEEEEKFLIIKAEEITDSYKKKPIHMNATNVQGLIRPQGGKSVAEVMQNNIDAVREHREKTGEPVLIHLNHPNFYWAVKARDLKKVEGERFFEVYNGHPAVENYGDSKHLSTEEIWDNVNLHYRKNGQPLLLGLATDDSHNYHTFGKDFSNYGRGWVMVRTDELTPAKLIEAMERGDFYSSTGVTLSTWSTEDQNIQIEVEAEPGVEYRIQFIGVKKGDKKSTVLEEITGTKASYPLKEVYFVRAKVISNRLQENPYIPGDFETAWTQPVWE